MDIITDTSLNLMKALRDFAKEVKDEEPRSADLLNMAACCVEHVLLDHGETTKAGVILHVVKEQLQD